MPDLQKPFILAGVFLLLLKKKKKSLFRLHTKIFWIKNTHNSTKQIKRVFSHDILILRFFHNFEVTG